MFSINDRLKGLFERFTQSQPVCLACFSDRADGLSLIDLFKKEDLLCGYCRQAFKVLRKQVKVMDYEVYAYYEYDAYFEKLIYQVKESKDETLAPVFLHPYVSHLKKLIGDKTVILVPSSAKKTKQRGFDALKALYSGLDQQLNCPFEKDDVKQSQRSLTQRSHIKRHLRLIDIQAIEGKDVVLLDDVCTTGYSLKACIDLIKPHVKSITVMVLAMHPDNLNTNSPL